MVADFVPSLPFESLNAQTIGGRLDNSTSKNKQDQRFVIYSCSACFLLFLIGLSKYWYDQL